MFIALQFERTERRGVAGKLLDRLRASHLTCELREALGGRYLLVRWTGASRPDWDEIGEACSRYRERILIPEGVQPPEQSRLRIPALPRFERHILLETACEIARRSKLPLYRRILGLVDQDGALAGTLPALLRHYSCVKVVTGALALYTDESDRMMRELGAPVLVGCELASLSDCMLLLTPENSRASGFPRAPVLCCRGFPGGSPCITMPEITPPPEVSAVCPDGISPQLFAGALYEFSGVTQMNLIASDMLCDYRRAALPEVVRAVVDCVSARF